MVGGFSTNHAVRSGTNLQLCSRYLIVVTHASGISIQGVWKKDDIVNFWHVSSNPAFQQNCLVWNVTRLHPLIHGGRVSLPRAFHGLGSGDEWHFSLRMDIYVHPGINKEGIQRKHISFCG